MITFEDAVKKASEYLSDTEFPVVITSQGRFSEGWFFCFESREYIETGDSSAQLAGNAPFIIDKDNGDIYLLGTAQPLREYLQEYEEKKNNRSQ
ncbi:MULTISPECIES: YrhB domain-containing protein [unclassified Serratia (in: enterobacteria)]|uniref:YrhB domain-containing protein n=1 Tax=unclassified Serratia (in: enterobacteria) TaxID=2647522 RepID=UPI00046991ED|nr:MULTISPECIES: YrhB domain-containing protein [unclassified Serratia (in: enterobacteria)]